MKLNAIVIENYRCFERLEVTLHPTITVLVAPNGGGKTTLIDAARIALWPFVRAFDSGSQAGKAATIQIEDVRLSKSAEGSMEPDVPASVTATGVWESEGERQTWRQTREKLKPGTNTLMDASTKQLIDYGKQLQQRVRDKTRTSPMDLPLVVYLGTGRLWYQGRYTAKMEDKKLDASMHSRLWGYQNCLSAVSSYKQFEDWYGWIYRSYEQQALWQWQGNSSFDEGQLSHFKAAVDVLTRAINEVTEKTTGWHDIQYNAGQQQQLVLNHKAHGALPLSQLSDGLRNIVVLVADIAFRCIKLNPHLEAEAALKTQGVVMIDEVDMFLHPAWQQTVIGSLTRAFPKVQFIVTTHSPQVLSTVPSESIRMIEYSADPESDVIVSMAKTPSLQSRGVASPNLMADIQGVGPIPDVEEARWVSRYTELIAKDLYESDEGVSLRKQLLAHFGEDHPEIRECDRAIRLQVMRAKLPTRKG